MTYKADFYPEFRFGGFTDVDGTISFYTRVNALLAPHFVVVDFGCGRGQFKEDGVEWRRNLRVLRKKVQRVVGVDVDAAALTNPFLDECRIIKPGEPWPVIGNSVDLLVCDSVVEHLPDPNLFFSEAKRILIPGSGLLCIRTPNAWSYVGLAQRLIPNAYHARVLSRVQEGRKEEDVFPTFYRCNTISKLRKMMERHDFDAVVHGHESEPSYANFSRLFYAAGVVHQKLAPHFFSPVIHAFGRRR